MKFILLVGLGSFFGGIGRYLVSLPFQNRLLFTFPFATLAANVVGCFLMGIVYSAFMRGWMTTDWRMFFATGLLGGFTTFSAFSLETVTLFKDGSHVTAALYVLLSIVLGIAATFAGMAIIKT